MARHTPETVTLDIKITAPSGTMVMQHLENTLALLKLGYDRGESTFDADPDPGVVPGTDLSAFVSFSVTTTPQAQDGTDG